MQTNPIERYLRLLRKQTLLKLKLSAGPPIAASLQLSVTDVPTSSANVIGAIESVGDRLGWIWIAAEMKGHEKELSKARDQGLSNGEQWRNHEWVLKREGERWEGVGLGRGGGEMLGG